MLCGGTLRVSQTLPPMDGAAADRDAAEDRRAGVDHDVVFDDRMARLAFDERARFIDREPLRAKRDRLIDPHAFADDGRLADDDAGAVIDEEAAADLRARMNVDAGLRMRELRDDARNDGRTEQMQRVRDAVMR